MMKRGDRKRFREGYEAGKDVETRMEGGKIGVFVRKGRGRGERERKKWKRSRKNGGVEGLLRGTVGLRDGRGSENVRACVCVCMCVCVCVCVCVCA